MDSAHQKWNDEMIAGQKALKIVRGLRGSLVIALDEGRLFGNSDVPVESPEAISIVRTIIAALPAD